MTDKIQDKKQEEIKDFKIAEIWVRSGQIMLDAPKDFFAGKVQALGILEVCKDIVKTNKPPKESKVIKPSGFKNFVRGLKRR